MTGLRALCALAAMLALAACSGEAAPPTLQGYVEGDFLRIAPESAGRLTRLDVEKGDSVAAGAPLFALDTRDETAALEEAEAERAAANASLQDLLTGRRPEEIAVLESNLAEAKAQQSAAEKAYTRNQALETRAVASAAALDQSRADLDAANARVDAATRNLAVARLPARPNAIEQARASLAARESAVTAAKTRLERRKVVAPADGRIDDVYFRAGEMVPAGSSVLSLLPPGNRHVVFFLPEPRRSAVQPGDVVAVSCDGCAAGLTATVSRIADNAEFAPPVIYSTESRSRLVWRVEAKPDANAASLTPGQPVDVTLASGAP